VTVLKNRIVLGKGHARSWAPAILVLFALFYYGSYALSGLARAGEGGTIAVIAQRIDEGQRPIVDTFLGYNILWYYPVAWLFRIASKYSGNKAAGELLRARTACPCVRGEPA